MIKILATTAAVVLAIISTTAHASLVLTLDDLGTVGIDVMVIDNAVGDSNPTAGRISYGSGPVGAFTFQMSNGTSKPFLGNDPFNAHLHLFNNSVTTSTGGTLRVRLTDTDFNLVPGTSDFASLTSAFGGFVSSGGQIIEANQYVDLDNNEFGIVGPNVIQLNHGSLTGAFSDVLTTPFGYTGGDFSITEEVLITLGASSSASFGFDSWVVPLPEPSTLGIWSVLGLVGAGVQRRRRHRAA